MTPKTEEKIQQSIKILQAVQKTMLFPDEPIELGYSGGKDSDVILHLAKEAGINVLPIYKNTTIDPPGTIQHAIDNGAKIIRPKRSFFEIIDAKGYPSRFHRFCCEELKEYKISDTCIMGIRKDESSKRDKNYSEPIACRVYKNGRIDGVYPILYWNTEDVEEYIKDRQIQCAPVYYENGIFNVHKRLGCMCCPLAGRRIRIEEFKKYPGMLKAYLKHGEIYFNTHPNVKAVRDFPSAAHYLFLNIYCDDMEQYNKLTAGLDVKQYLSDQFKIDL